MMVKSNLPICDAVRKLSLLSLTKPAATKSIPLAPKPVAGRGRTGGDGAGARAIGAPTTGVEMQ